MLGIFVVASAGNDPPNAPECGTADGVPARLEDVITVGALDQKSHRIIKFSSRGPVENFTYIKPDLVAPGVNIISAGHENRYVYGSGTSMAQPAVNGAIGLLWSAIPKLKGNLELTQKIFEETAEHQQDGTCDTKPKSPNFVYGYGTINVGRAFERALQIVQ